MNMTKSIIRALAACLCLLAGFSATRAYADTLTLSDGSILNGQIVRIEGGDIILSTAYAGEITVKQAQVVEIATADPVFVQSGDTTIFGTVSTSTDGLVVTTDNASLDTDVTAVSAVWREGDQSPEAKALARKWFYNANFGLTGSSGNTDRFAILAQGRATLQGPDDRLTFYLSYDNSETDGVRSSDELKGGVDYSRLISKKWGWYVRTELESDEAEALDLRVTAGGGAKYVWQDTENWDLELRGGLGYRYESYYDGRVNDVPGLDFVLINSYTFAGIGTMKNVVTYNPAFEDFGNYRAFQETTFELPLGTGDQWRLRLGFSNDYNSRPAAGREKMDMTYFTQFMLAWE
jgi:hypothetical protein